MTAVFLADLQEIRGQEAAKETKDTEEKKGWGGGLNPSESGQSTVEQSLVLL